MKRITWLILILVIVSVMLIVVNTGVTTSYFTDAELSTDDTLNIRWSVTLLSDGFEDLQWDVNWDGNGATDWTQNSSTIHGGLYSAGHASGNTYLTSDNLDASDATSITVSFWFYIKDLNKGPLCVQIYNGSTYNNLYDDLTTYPGVTKTTWYQFSQTITDLQYFISNFRLRFDGSTEATSSFVDDVLIQKN